MADPRLQARRDVVQVPLYSTEEAYYSAAQPTTGYETNRQVLVNMFPVVNKDPLRDDGGEVRLLSRPGLSTPVTTNSDLDTIISQSYTETLAVLGMRGTPDEVLVVAYTDLDGVLGYVVHIVQYRPGVSTILIGTIDISVYGFADHDNIAVNLSEITHSTGPALAVTIHPRTGRSTSSNSDMFYAATTSGYFTAASLVTIADTSFPTNTPAKGIVGAVVQLNNVHYIMTADGFIYGSYPSNTYPFNPDISVWDDAGNTTASQDMDGGIGLVRYKHHLIAFGTSSMEFFNDEGLAKPSLPIQRTQQAYIKIGLANSKAVTVIGDDLYWIGSSQETGGIGLYRLSGYTPELISSIPINHELSVYGRANAELYPFYTMGTTHIITNVPTLPQINGADIMGADEPDNNTFAGTLVYCVTSKTWWSWAFEFTDYVSGVISFGNQYAPQLKVATTINGLTAARWIYVNAFKNASVESLGWHPIKLSQNQEADDGAHYDKFRINTGSSFLTYRIPAAIRTNRIQFNTLNRKTIHKVKLHYRTLDQTNEVFLPAEEWKLYISAWKDTASDALGPVATQVDADISRTIDLELPAYNPFMTMYNFGTCRSVVFQILSNNAYHLELGHLEVTLSLADH